jgi:hypothetical protein
MTLSDIEANDLAVRMYRAGYAAGAAHADVDREIAERTADYWYLRAHYTEAEILDWQQTAIDTAAEEHWIALLEAGQRLGEPVTLAITDALEGRQADLDAMTERQTAWEHRAQAVA